MMCSLPLFGGAAIILAATGTLSLCAHEIQIIATVLSSDKERNADTLAMLGASAALHISNIPFADPVTARRTPPGSSGS